RAWWRQSELSTCPPLRPASLERRVTGTKPHSGASIRQRSRAADPVVTRHSALPERNHVLQRIRDRANLGAPRPGSSAPHPSRRSKCSQGGRASNSAARARRNRPRRRRAAEQGDELAPPYHSITSSARASSVGGTSRLSAFAVFKLITSSYLVGACTGRSAG